jgi:hypothetical protein
MNTFPNVEFHLSKKTEKGSMVSQKYQLLGTRSEK